MKNANKPEESCNMVKYQANDGVDVTLSTQIVKDFLVHGKSDLVSTQEIVFFLGICKARKLNPFTKEVYLIKYSSEPAAIIASIDYFRARARAQKDCRGWKRGVIVQDKDGNIKDTAGLVLEGETLVGGFFEATPEGWAEPMRLEVNLRGYIKKTGTGQITKFWKPDNQPTMIAKVAEGQGLRSVWPGEFAKMYESSEILIPDDNDIVTSRTPQAQPGSPKTFENCIPAGTDIKILDEFLEIVAGDYGRTIEEQKAVAIDNPRFWQGLKDFSMTVNAPAEGTIVDAEFPDESVLELNPPETQKVKSPPPAEEKAETTEAKYLSPCRTMKNEGGRRNIKYCESRCKDKCQVYWDAIGGRPDEIPNGG